MVVICLLLIYCRWVYNTPKSESSPRGFPMRQKTCSISEQVLFKYLCPSKITRSSGLLDGYWNFNFNLIKYRLNLRPVDRLMFA